MWKGISQNEPIEKNHITFQQPSTKPQNNQDSKNQLLSADNSIQKGFVNLKVTQLKFNSHCLRQKNRRNGTFKSDVSNTIGWGIGIG